ncbi:hypothetical protein [Pelagibius sp. Alg239-R121]|uniref:hypothetical protein n=1 Tax=Pelagibius sp. Alg239-R121 TaxID=2993448 RepID=UPI0024A74839|nr:hypothetical protein [Pelagibius sp. Alg239-R121]
MKKIGRKRLTVSDLQPVVTGGVESGGRSAQRASAAPSLAGGRLHNGDLTASDMGVSARARHNGGILVEARSVSVQGNVVMVGAKARYECLLDQLLDQEVIKPELYDAGVWLRSLYLRTRVSEGVSRYGDLGFDRDGGRSSFGPEMSDELAWNLRVLRDTMLSLGGHWASLRKLCCDDQMPASRRTLNDGLSALAKLRGFV